MEAPAKTRVQKMTMTASKMMASADAASAKTGAQETTAQKAMMMAASDRRDKLAAAALAMGFTFLLASLPNRAGILIAVLASVLIMLAQRRQRS